MMIEDSTGDAAKSDFQKSRVGGIADGDSKRKDTINSKLKFINDREAIIFAYAVS